MFWWKMLLGNRRKMLNKLLVTLLKWEKRKVSNINTALKFLKTKEFWVSAFDVHAKKDFTNHNWEGKNVLLFGSEGYGLKENTLKNADFNFKIDISKNIESLNISNTVSIVCHHINKTRKS